MPFPRNGRGQFVGSFGIPFNGAPRYNDRLAGYVPDRSPAKDVPIVVFGEKPPIKRKK